MAKQNNFLGVASVKIGAPGDGVMGSSLTEYTDIENNSVNIEGATVTDTVIPTEADDNYLIVSEGGDPTTITMRLFGVTPAQMVELAGGAVNGTSGLWEQPIAVPNKYVSLEVIGKEIDGKKGTLEVPYGKITARIQGNITKNGLPAVDVSIKVATPVSAAEAVGVPFSFGYIDA